MVSKMDFPCVCPIVEIAFTIADIIRGVLRRVEIKLSNSSLGLAHIGSALPVRTKPLARRTLPRA
jgi:hypothetical protein